ncbi:MAG: molecular chaperone DnaJ [Clostridia bacterium]
MEQRDYYEVLELSKDATPEEVKKAYRRLARQYHPDVNQEDHKAEAKFKEVKDAYDILSDADKKARYDRYGHAGVNDNASGGFGGGFSDFGGVGDIFDMFFGGSGFGGNSGQNRTAPRRGEDLRFDLKITFEQAAFGFATDINIQRIENCNECGGSGAAKGTEPQTCPDCHGSGQIRVTQQTFLGAMQSMKTCPTCNGGGKIIANPCPVCKGKGRVKKHKTIHVDIPAGIDEAARLRVSGEGNAGANGGPAGDLYIFISVDEHKIFTRFGYDLYCEVPISFVDATLGADLVIPGLQREVDLHIPEGTQTETEFKVRGAGIQHLRSTSMGDMHVKVVVSIPKDLNDEQKDILRKFSIAVPKDKWHSSIGYHKDGLWEKLKDFGKDKKKKKKK